ncbi:MAG: pyridoxamine 5'-phosphate oxidase family protein [Thermomicrobiales bacterium]
MATADAGKGAPYLIPLSFSWDGQTLLFATPRNSVTGRNIRETGKVLVSVSAPPATSF